MNQPTNQKLPVWRLIAGAAVFFGLFADLSLLAPVYLRNFRLERDLTHELRTPGAAARSDEYWRKEMITRARSLDLPLIANDIRVLHSSGVTTLQTSYKIQVDLGLYQVDLHFHPKASSR